MNNFQVVQNEYISPIDLATMSKAYDSLEEGHINAVKAQSELESAIAQLDMNSEEDEFKANLVNDLRNNIAEHTLYGNMAGAYSTIIQQSGKILSSPEVLGRIKSQTAYKNFQDNVDKNTTLPGDMKEWYKELNSYYYTDKYNDQGQIIGGSEWKPTKNYCDRVDETEVMKALKDIVASQTVSWDNVTWVDAQGNTYEDYQPGLYVGIQTAGKTEYITAEQFKTAMSGLLRSNSKIANSITSDYEYLNWAYKQGKDNRILDDDGHIMTLDQYVDSVYNPLYNVAAYKRESWSTQYHYPLLMGAGGSGGSGGSGDSDNVEDYWTPSRSQGNPIKIENREAQIAIQHNNEIFNEIKTNYSQIDGNILNDILSLNNINLDSNIDDIYNNIINSQSLNENQKIELAEYVDTIRTNNHTISSILNSCNPDIKNKFIEKLAVESNKGVSELGITDTSDCKLVNTIDKEFNNFADNDGNAVLTLDANTYDNVDFNELKDLGVEVIQNSNGNITLKVASNLKNRFYNILQCLDSLVVLEPKSTWFRNLIANEPGVNFNANISASPRSQQIKETIARVKGVYNQYDETINKNLSNKYVSQDTILIGGAVSLDSLKYESDFMNSSGGAVAQNKSKQQFITETDIDLIKNTDAANMRVYMPPGSAKHGQFVQTRTLVDSKKAQGIRELLNNTELEKNLKYTLAYYPLTGEYGVEVTFPVTKKPSNVPSNFKYLFEHNKSVFIVIPNAKFDDKLKANTSIQADVDCQQANLLGKSFGFDNLYCEQANYHVTSEYNSFDNSYNIKLKYHGKDYDVNNRYNDIKQLREIQLNMQRAYRMAAVQSDDDIKQQYVNVINNYIEQYARLLNSLTDQDANIEDVINDLQTNLRY